MTRIEELQELRGAIQSVIESSQCQDDDWCENLLASMQTWRERIENIDHLTAEVERLNKKQTWDDLESTRLSCSLVGSQREIEKLTVQLAAKDAEIERLRDACEKVLTQSYNVRAKIGAETSNTDIAIAYANAFVAATVACQSALAATPEKKGV